MHPFLPLVFGTTALICAPGISAGSQKASAETAVTQAAGKPGTEATQKANAASASDLDFSDMQDFADARRDFIAPLPDNGQILDKDGKVTWNLGSYSFLATSPSAQQDTPRRTPDTVQPSLWRQSQLVFLHGLFQVTDRIYQVRNADISNMTIL